MFGITVSRRTITLMIGTTLLAGCKVIPDNGTPTTPRPVPTPGGLPSDAQRHRIALLVPMSGSNAAVGQAIANAATMALLDSGARNLRITNYDTAPNAAAAAAQAVSDRNTLILGPLFAADIPAVAATALSAGVPVISFSNDADSAGSAVFVMGALPAQSVARTVAYARQQGVTKLGALIPNGDYGRYATAALMTSARSTGATVSAIETFDRTSGGMNIAARRLRLKAPYDAVMIADSSRFAIQAAAVVKPSAGAASPRLLGTELWNGDGDVARAAALRGAWFSAVSDARFRQFSEAYAARFGNQPVRVATLGYDAVLMTIKLAREWKPGTALPALRIVNAGPYTGIDGAYRFNANGLNQRAFEVREVRASGVVVVSPAPTKL